MLSTVTNNLLTPHKFPSLGYYRNANLIKVLNQSITQFKIMESFSTTTSAAKENFRISFQISQESRNSSIGSSRFSLIGETIMGEKVGEMLFTLMTTLTSKKYYSFLSKNR